jgi:predicted metal-dependent hydrolase
MNTHSRPAPTPADLRQAAEDFIEGPNVEASPWEVEAARGHTSLEGPHAQDRIDWDTFVARYADWKSATERFEEAVRDMRDGAAGARVRAQQLARELASLHHAFMESSQPWFKASSAE